MTIKVRDQLLSWRNFALSEDQSSNLWITNPMMPLYSLAGGQK
jgi:hypothetical protein